MTRARTVRLTAVATAAIAALTGCGNPDTSTGATTTTPATTACSDGSAAYQPPDEVCNATMVWSAEPGIDLYSPEATLVRAAWESDEIGSYAGLEQTYPGFARALSPEYHGRGRYREERYRGTVFGTVLGHILEIETTADGFLGKFCVLSNGFARLEDDGRYARSNGRGFDPEVRFTRTETASPSTDTATTAPTTYAPAPDRLQWQAPTYDVFDGWRVSFPTRYEDRNRCDAWALSQDPDAPAEVEAVYSDTPPPVLPAYPGWPATPD